jgi:hypothetical protein
VIVGFTVGCGLGAACEAALAMGFAAERDDGPH